ncbi:LytR family transcriptional regulator [Clostridium tarantellae]|uniref:LytR family transcriptional regulator n=1 Tax=Clostridium tarantellae TaxID=39493 RepID=A0A6I1MQM4_9CLOT|nr:LytR family transcriptional regulator [Clostridium tarantellae]
MKRKKKKYKKIITIVVLVIVLLVVGVTIGGISYTYTLLDKVNTIEVDEQNLSVNDKLNKYDVENIALFGVDTTDGGVGRTDSIMILTIDKERKKLKISSIMRDSYVDINGHKKDKLNHAYAFGGSELAIKTLNENFDLNIKNFVSVNFSTLPKIIDKLGGVELEITAEELKLLNPLIDDMNRLNGTKVKHLNSVGIQQLNGTQAMAYSRIRYTSGGDYERTQRHRNVLNALMGKVQNISPSKLPGLLNELLPMVETSLTSNKILKLGGDVLSLGNLKFEQDRFPRDGYCEGKMINGVYYLTFNKDATVNQIHDYIVNDIK